MIVSLEMQGKGTELGGRAAMNVGDERQQSGSSPSGISTKHALRLRECFLDSYNKYIVSIRIYILSNCQVSSILLCSAAGLELAGFVNLARGSLRHLCAPNFVLYARKAWCFASGSAHSH